MKYVPRTAKEDLLRTLYGEEGDEQPSSMSRLFRFDTVCVIGLGPSGLSAVKELRANGLEVAAFDSASRIGGRWAQHGDDRSSNRAGGIWDEAYLGCGRSLGEFSDFPWRREDYINRPYVLADKFGVFPHCTEVRAYLEAYLKHFGLEESLRLESTVTLVNRHGSGWNVQTVDSSGRTAMHHFDAVVYCTGASSIPVNPLVKGDGTGLLDAFEGEVLHLADVRSLSQFDGQRVLTVGSKGFGSDFTSQLSERQQAAAVVHSVRRAPYVINWKSPVNGQTGSALIGATRGSLWRHKNQPAERRAEEIKGDILNFFPNQITSDISGHDTLVPDEDVRKAGVITAYDYVERLEQRKFHLKPSISSAKGKVVTFSDGTRHEFDVVVCQTGFAPDLSLLPKELKAKMYFGDEATGHETLALHNHTLVADVPNTALLGYSQKNSRFSVAEMCARYVGLCFSGKMPRNPEWRMRESVEAVRKAKTTSSDIVFNSDVAILEEIGHEIGVAPSCWQCALDTRRLVREPIYPATYRTKPGRDEPSVVKLAKERFAWCVANREVVTTTKPGETYRRRRSSGS